MVGASIATWVPPVTALNAARIAISVFPNPTDQKTNIQVNLAEKGVVKVDIYNIKGQLIENIANRALEKGKHQFEWDSGNHPTGTYFIHFDLDGNLVNKQLMLKK